MLSALKKNFELGYNWGITYKNKGLTYRQTLVLLCFQRLIDKIAETSTNYSDRPLQPQVVNTVTVDTFGVEYLELEKQAER